MQAPAPPWVWIDGAVIAADEARVGILDHGFLYGDSIYETLRLHEGRPFRLDAHLDRLEASAEAVGLDVPWTRDELRKILRETAEAGPDDHDVGLRLMVTRGEGPLGIDPTLCPEPRLLVIGWAVARGDHPMAEAGVSVVITGVRRNPPSALDPSIKSGNFLNNILAFREAKEADAFEGILLTVDGAIAEATTSNVFWVHDGEVRTSEDRGILLGVTRLTVLEILEAEGIPHRRGAFPPEDLREADEAFLTSTLKGILPIRSVDGVGIPARGPLTAKIADAYRRRTRPEGE